MITECCSESRMRSRTSRGVPEWSGGEDLYMGSHHMVTGSIRGFAGIVPGPPKGFRGSTGRVHLPRRALWAVGGREPAPKWAGHQPPPRAHAPRVGGNPGGGAPLDLGGKPPSLAAAPPTRWDLRGPAPLSLAPIYSGGVGGQPHVFPGAALPPHTPPHPPPPPP